MDSESPVKNRRFGSCISSIGSLLGGVGLFLAGISALVALSRTDGILENILEIRSTSEQIRTGVQQITIAVKQLDKHVITQASHGIVEQTKNLNKEQIAKVINEIPSEKSGVKAGDIYLPSQLRAQVIDELSSTKNMHEKSLLLQRNLQIKRPENYQLK